MCNSLFSYVIQNCIQSIYNEWNKAHYSTHSDFKATLQIRDIPRMFNINCHYTMENIILNSAQYLIARVYNIMLRYQASHKLVQISVSVTLMGALMNSTQKQKKNNNFN